MRKANILSDFLLPAYEVCGKGRSQVWGVLSPGCGGGGGQGSPVPGLGWGVEWGLGGWGYPKFFGIFFFFNFFSQRQGGCAVCLLRSRRRTFLFDR